MCINTDLNLSTLPLPGCAFDFDCDRLVVSWPADIQTIRFERGEPDFQLGFGEALFSLALGGEH